MHGHVRAALVQRVRVVALAANTGLATTECLAGLARTRSAGAMEALVLDVVQAETVEAVVSLLLAQERTE